MHLVAARGRGALVCWPPSENRPCSIHEDRPRRRPAAVPGCLFVQPKAEWVKPKASKDDTYTQLSDCQYQVGLAKVPEDEREQMVAHCMRGKGFRYVAIPAAK